MTIARTAIVDDDGTGTTGTVLSNAWKTELYNQIDALAVGSTSWTPTDASGATLVFTSVTAKYGEAWPFLYISLDLTYPSTASGATANIGGLPVASVASSSFATGYTTFATAFTAYLAAAATSFQMYALAGAATITNANLSLKRIALSGVYLIG